MNCLRLVAVVVVLLAGCEQQSKQEHAIARVGNAVLTLEQARLAIDTTVAPFHDQLQQYTSSWITTELLFQEALKRGIDQGNDFQRQLNDVRKQLTVQAYLQSTVYADTASPPDEPLQSYVEAHAAEFLAREDLIKMNLIAFVSREQASVFAGKVIRGASWSDTYKEFLDNADNNSEIVFVASGAHYSQRTLLYPELWKAAQTLDENDVSFPVRTPSGYFIIQALSMTKRGSMPPFEVVKEEARLRLLRERQQQAYDSLVGTLRRQYSVEMILPEKNQPDSAQNKYHK